MRTSGFLQEIDFIGLFLYKGSRNKLVMMYISAGNWTLIYNIHATLLIVFIACGSDWLRRGCAFKCIRSAPVKSGYYLYFELNYSPFSWAKVFTYICYSELTWCENRWNFVLYYLIEHLHFTFFSPTFTFSQQGHN